MTRLDLCFESITLIVVWKVGWTGNRVDTSKQVSRLLNSVRDGGDNLDWGGSNGGRLQWRY